MLIDSCLLLFVRERWPPLSTVMKGVRCDVSKSAAEQEKKGRKHKTHLRKLAICHMTFSFLCGLHGV